MWECRHCGEFVRGTREHLPARCPHCREPLFERGLPPVLVREQPSEHGPCATHPETAAIGLCKRCGNAFCPVCRTRWHDRILCLKCVERFLSGDVINPLDRQAHPRQAILGCVFGIGAWLLCGLAIAALLPANRGTNPDSLLVLAYILGIAGFLAATAGLAQAVTALRARGPQMLVATAGLLLNGVFLGGSLGLILLQASRL